MRATWHRIPIYKARVKVVYSPEELPPEALPQVPVSDALCGEVVSGRVYMWFDPAALTMGTVAHECLHACNFIMQSRGVASDRDNDEPDAYLLGYLVDHVVKVLRKRGAKL